MAGYKKMHKFIDVITYFSLKSWIFRDNNTRSLAKNMSKLDQSLFQMDMNNLNWDQYFKDHVIGVRLHILKDPLESLAEGRKRSQKSVNYRFIKL